ncbi:hypothetical protein [Nisaea sp.]|uniref:hypothetical protein n=1 Tax=Nisaea sp. TaxID=2024842 RepID=UPI003296D7C5
MLRLIAFGFGPLALVALAVLLAPPPALALPNDAHFTLTNYDEPSGLTNPGFFDLLELPAIADLQEDIEAYHEPGNRQFGIGHYSLTEAMRHNALAFALVGNASHAPEVASPPSIAG